MKSKPIKLALILITGTVIISSFTLIRFRDKSNSNCSNNTIYLTDNSGETKIGNQIWMTQNLDVETYRNGDPIPQVQDTKEWKKLKTGAWCYYENNTENGKIFGKIYNWYAVNDPRGLAPKGWHVPTEQEWAKIAEFTENHTNPESGTKLKSKTGWKDYEAKGKKILGNGTDTYGFNAQAGGMRSDLGNFKLINEECWWWTATEKQFMGWCFGLRAWETSALRTADLKAKGFYVRCVKD